MLMVKGRNEDKVSFAADHLKRELESALSEISDLVIAGPVPAPLARVETQYRYQILLRTRTMARLSRKLAKVVERQTLPEDLVLSVDIDPVNLS